MRRIKKYIDQFFRLESASGILLLVILALSILWRNSPAGFLYGDLFEGTHNLYFFGHYLKFSLNFLINDGLMTIFFFVVGLEIKREFIEGTLKDYKTSILPIVSAVFGIGVPAAIYLLVMKGESAVLKAGWAIPAATDIAFAVGVFMLVGRNLPRTLRIFLLTVAIIDDLGAILIISIFYTNEVHLLYILGVLGFAGLLMILNKLSISNRLLLLMIGIGCWFCMLKAGIHPTVAGVLVALFTPFKGKHMSSFRFLETKLHAWSSFFIIPLFVLANSGIDMHEIMMSGGESVLPLAIALGLFFGKQVGLMAGVFLSRAAKVSFFEPEVKISQIWGVSVLAGIGFTMSFFINNLSFDQAQLLSEGKFGVIIGSVISAVLGGLILKVTAPRR